jgi:hypothetical protein
MSIIKINFCKVTAASILMYRSENWALIRSERRKIEAAEMRFLGRVSGYTPTDHVRSTTILDAL